MVSLRIKICLGLEDSYVKNAKSYGMNVTPIGNQDPDQWAINQMDDFDKYFQRYLTGAVFDQSSGESLVNITTNSTDIDGEVWYNAEALHTAPISINLFFESLLKLISPEREGERLISVSNHPLSSQIPKLNPSSIVFGWGVTCLLLIPITVPFLGASYVLFPISERISKAKLLQLMTGLSTLMFWLSNFVFDLLNHSIVVIIIYIIFAIFDFNGIFFGRMDSALALLLMLFMFGFASIPLAYLFSLVLGKPTTGFAVLVIIYLLFGVIAVSIMGTIEYSDKLSEKVMVNPILFNVILYIFRVVPVFSMSFGLQRLYRTSSFTKFCEELNAFDSKFQNYCSEKVKEKSNFLYGCCSVNCSLTNECYVQKSALSFDEYGVSTDLVFLIVCGILFMALLLMFESKFETEYNL